jgi:hypothetical protein
VLSELATASYSAASWDLLSNSRETSLTLRMLTLGNLEEPGMAVHVAVIGLHS